MIVAIVETCEKIIDFRQKWSESQNSWAKLTSLKIFSKLAKVKEIVKGVKFLEKILAKISNPGDQI